MQLDQFKQLDCPLRQQGPLAETLWNWSLLAKRATWVME
jgi:hypothetical protein